MAYSAAGNVRRLRDLLQQAMEDQNHVLIVHSLAAVFSDLNAADEIRLAREYLVKAKGDLVGFDHAVNSVNKRFHADALRGVKSQAVLPGAIEDARRAIANSRAQHLRLTEAQRSQLQVQAEDYLNLGQTRRAQDAFMRLLAPEGLVRTAKQAISGQDPFMAGHILWSAILLSDDQTVLGREQLLK